MIVMTDDYIGVLQMYTGIYTYIYIYIYNRVGVVKEGLIVLASLA